MNSDTLFFGIHDLQSIEVFESRSLFPLVEMQSSLVSIAQRSRAHLRTRCLSDLAFHKYPFLAKLGLEEDNFGCWNGKEWRGNGY